MNRTRDAKRVRSSSGRVRHSVDVQADTLYEAVVLAVKRFREDIWSEQVAAGTSLEVEVRAPATKHSLTLQQVE